MIDRSTIITGPAVVTQNGVTYYTKGDIVVDIDLELFPIDSSLHGKIDQRVKERRVKVSFTPIGEWESLTAVWAWLASIVGSSLFTGTDKPLVIKTLAGRVITWAASAVKAMPVINLSSVQTIHGSMEFMCLGANSDVWTTSGNLWTDVSGAFSDTSLSSAAIITQPYTCAWGAAPWDSFQTKTGVLIEPTITTYEVETDTDGVVDLKLDGLEVMATLTPVGMTETQMLNAMKLQGSGNVRGRSMNANSADLIISGTGVTCTVKAAQMQSSKMNFGQGSPRIGETKFVATRTVTAGVVSPMLVLA